MIIGILILRREVSEYQIYTVGKVGLSNLSCVDWLSARLVALLVEKIGRGDDTSR